MSFDENTINMLSCEESPLFFPNGMSVDSINLCKTCTLRLVSKLPGPGNIIGVNENNIIINENPTNSFIVDGIMYNLMQTVLVFKGLHRLPGRNLVSDAELCLAFSPSQGKGEGFVVLCLPIDIGDTTQKNYFSTISNYPSGNRPAIGSLISESATFLSYRGPSIFSLRTKKNPRPRDVCDPIKTHMRYFICLTPIRMNVKDYERFYEMMPKEKYTNPAGATLTRIVETVEPIAELTVERCKLLTRINGITVETATKRPKAVVNSAQGYSPDSLKCYRLDKQRDIVDDKIYINGNGRPGNTTLTKEMAAAAGGEDISITELPEWTPEITSWPVSFDELSLMNDPYYNKLKESRDGFKDLDKLKAACKADDRCQAIFKYKEARNNNTGYIPVKTAGVVGTPSPDPNWETEFSEHTFINKITPTLPSVKPGDIERILGTILGIVFGLVLCAVIAYYVLKCTNTNYLDVLKLYGTTPVTTVTALGKVLSSPV